MVTDDIKKFLKRCGGFLLLAPLVWFVFIAVWGTIVHENFRKNLIYGRAQGFMGLRFKQADTIRDVELMIVGSSHVYRGIDPRILLENGITSFNLGSSLQTPIQTEYLLHRYLEQMSPKVVVFEVGFKTFSSDGVESAIDIVTSVEQVDKEMLRMVASLNDIKVYNSLAYSMFRRFLTGETRVDYLAKHGEVDRYIDGGFVERIGFEYSGPTEFDAKLKPIEPAQKKAFERCLKYLEQKRVKVLLVQTPIFYDYYTSIKNYQEYDQYFYKATSARYVNFSDSIYNNTDYFYDHHHLNQKGVQEFNEDLLKVLMPDLAPDHGVLSTAQR